MEMDIKNLEIQKKYIELLKKYRERNFKNIEIVEENGFYLSDIIMLPRYWNKVESLEKRISFLEESLSKDIPIEEIEEYRNFKLDRTLEDVDRLKNEYNKKRTK